MKIQGFKADVYSTKYVKFENKSAFTKEEQPEIFLCNVVVDEVGRGLSRFRLQHQAALMMTQEMWENKVIEKGDRIEFFDTATWRPDPPVEYKTYDPKKIEKYDRSQVKVDKDGKVYASSKIFPYSLRAKIEDWALVGKFYDLNYCTVKASGVKLPIEDKKQFKNETSFEFILDDNEVELLEKFNNKTVLVIAYSCSNKFAEKEMDLTLRKDQSGANVLKLVQV